jgi:hypothetical protein
MFVLTLLLGYGLFFLPLNLWKRSDNQAILYKELETAHQVFREYREALTEFHTITSQIKNLCSNHRTGENTRFLDIMLDEIPEKDLEGQQIAHSQYFHLDIKEGRAINEDFLAEIRYKFKLTFFLYKRKKARWRTLFNKVDAIIEKPNEID